MVMSLWPRFLWPTLYVNIWRRCNVGYRVPVLAMRAASRIPGACSDVVNPRSTRPPAAQQPCPAGRRPGRRHGLPPRRRRRSDDVIRRQPIGAGIAPWRHARVVYRGRRVGCGPISSARQLKNGVAVSVNSLLGVSLPLPRSSRFYDE